MALPVDQVVKEERERVDALSRFDCLRRDCGRSNRLSSAGDRGFFSEWRGFRLRSPQYRWRQVLFIERLATRFDRLS